MRCYCCDRQLSDKESTRRFKESGEFTECCDQCLPDGVPTVTRRDLPGGGVEEIHEAAIYRFFEELENDEDG
jgi:hypothetical protein